MGLFFGVTLLDGRQVGVPLDSIKYFERVRGKKKLVRIYVQTDKGLRTVDVVADAWEFLGDLNHLQANR